MYGNCTAFLDNTLVAMAGGTQGLNEPWAFAWNKQLRMWEHLPPLPTAVANPGYGVIGSRLFAVGGYTSDRSQPESYGGPYSGYSARLQIFDAARQSWSLGPPLTQLKERFERPRHAVAYEDRFYVFCQKAGDPDVDDLRSLLASSPCHVYCFDPLSNLWSELPAVPTADSLCDLRAGVHDGRLIVVGTINDDPENTDLYEVEPSTYMYEWDDRAETWRAKSLLLDDISAWPAGRLESLVSVPLRIR
jgi:outer membrane protein assembly factor BamB